MNFSEEFKTENANHGKIETIISDKSFANRNAFQTSFPNANHQLCVFHVLQIFNREVTTQKRNITTAQKNAALDILHGMVYAKSGIVYDQYYRALQNLNCPGLITYFNRNWHNIQSQWVGYLVNRSPNYENRTNNRLESLNQKIKSVVTRYANLGTFFNELITLTTSYNIQRDHVAAENIMRKPLTTAVNTEYDDKYDEYLTQYAFMKYKKESAGSIRAQFSRLSDVEAECTQHNTQIIVTFDRCSCPFFTTTHLPCRHIIALLSIKEQPVFNPNLCANRWKREIAQYVSEFDYSVSNFTTSQLQVIQAANRQRPRSMTANEKFRLSEKETKKICEIFAEKNQQEFNELLQSLKQYRTCVESNQTPSKY